MAKSLKNWVETDVARVKDRPLKWLSEENFFRDPSRPVFSDAEYLFSPADGIVVYQQEVQPADCIVDIKGKAYSLRAAMQDESFDEPCLVIGIFMTMYDVHVNRVPYPGYVSYKALEPISSFNAPMLALEQALIDDVTVDCGAAGYLHSNQRMLNRIHSPLLGQHYYVLQIADYDVDCITPFNLGQNVHLGQNRRFSQIRFGSQVDLIVPLSKRFGFEPLQETGAHVEAGIDPLVKIVPKTGT
ncbi:MAG: phosphatidylserine decarboxylase [Proteobacteria bacterium]|nr:phosphatidylserine decarboxylase [Pseudomonadota bacterium]